MSHFRVAKDLEKDKNQEETANSKLDSKIERGAQVVAIATCPCAPKLPACFGMHGPAARKHPVRNGGVLKCVGVRQDATPTNVGTRKLYE
jgi:hypothetical protein